MLLKRSSILFVLFVLLVGFSTTYASAAKPDKSNDSEGLIIVSGYDVEPAFSAVSPYGVTAMATSSYSIRQGQTNWHSKYIPSGCPGYYADLDWSNSGNSLQLRIYAADGRCYGPYYDSSDGRMDGRILLWISTPSRSLPVGTYYHEVYGQKVSGTEYYSF